MSRAVMAARRAALSRETVAHEADYYLSDAIPDIRYYTGCMDAGGYLLVPGEAKAPAILITNAHDAPQAFAEATDTVILVWQPGDDPVSILLAQIPSDSARLLVSGLSAALHDELRHLGIAVRIEAGCASRLRRVKEAGELALMRQAARIVEAGMAAARDALRPGVREIEVAAEAEYAMRRLGMDGRVFETKVESGPRSAMPSTYAGERRIEQGDLVLIDIGPTYRGYFGDLTRTFSIGAPGPDQRALLELVLSAQSAGIATVRAGVTGEAVDDAAREPIRQAGLADGVLHNTGHSLGLAGDSLPLIAPGESTTLLAGECITVEPGVYREGIGGVRIEDEILVTESGCELLTSFPKSLKSLIVPV